MMMMKAAAVRSGTMHPMKPLSPTTPKMLLSTDYLKLAGSSATYPAIHSIAEKSYSRKLQPSALGARRCSLRGAEPRSRVRCLPPALYGEGGVAVNRRDLKKAAPFFGVLLIVAAVLYVVGRFLL
jgi:hypothetical protein